MMTGRFATRIGYEFTPFPIVLGEMLANSKDFKIHKALLHKEVFSSIPPMKDLVVPHNETYIPAALQSLGYRSYHLGKWHLGEAKQSTPIDRVSSYFLQIFCMKVS